jgi:hypothetical protein
MIGGLFALVIVEVRRVGAGLRFRHEHFLQEPPRCSARRRGGAGTEQEQCLSGGRHACALCQRVDDATG